MREIRKISRSSDVLFGEAMELYLYSFPPNERQALETISARLDKGLYILYTACEGNDVLAMLLLYPLEDVDFIVVDYLAVNVQYRSKGIGAWLLQEVMTAVQLDYEGKYLVLEAEDPNYGDNRPERVARIAFYKKRGARTLQQVRYILPPLAGDKPTEMILMLLPGYAGDSLAGTVVENLLVQMYRQLYGRGGKDELLQSFIGDVPATVDLAG